MSWLPDDIREASGGEVVDHVTHDVIKLAHQAIERFPEVKKRHMFIAGGAALSSALVIGAAVAIVRRLRDGQTPDEAVTGITEEELDGIHLLERERSARRTATNGHEDEPAATTEAADAAASSESR